jgi:hypothetical protein
MKRLIVWALGTAGLIAAWAVYINSQYPYGRSHCCDLELYFALDNYAAEHGKAYPAGEVTPEASLSLLYPKYIDANTLRGKTVPAEVVQAALDEDTRLGPETCGWHYVEGLRSDDDPRLAIFWDKVGLDHNGRRLERGSHIVMRLHCNREQIPAVEWDGFLAEQKQLREEAKLKRAKEN